MSLANLMKKHLVDSTAQCVVAHPLFALLETSVGQMSVNNSFHARCNATLMTYCGMGFLYSRGLDYSRKCFGAAVEGSMLRKSHDAGYGAIFNLFLAPLLYYSSGVRDMRELAVGTAFSVGVGAIGGAPFGYAVDRFRSLTGIIKSESPRRFDLAALAILASACLVGGVYAVGSHGSTTTQSTPDK